METCTLLTPNPRRYTLFPIQHDDVWVMAKQMEAVTWTAQEIDLNTDMREWSGRLNAGERSFISSVLAFFAGADGIVLENLARRFMCEVQWPEARAFYSYQMSSESVHAETYSLLIDTLIGDENEKERLFNGIETIPSVKRKAQWAQHWITDDSPFPIRLAAFAIVEGVFFSASFCAVFFLKKRGLMPGLSFSNELISRDEGLHTDFACLLFNKFGPSELPAQTTIHAMARDAYACEEMFVRDSLACDLIGMNSTLMCQYVKFVTDRLLKVLGYAALYNTKNPFEWMELISMEGKTNFFERRVSEYSRAGSALATDSSQSTSDNIFTLDAVF